MPLNFVASKNFPGDNLTTSNAQALYLRGAVPLAFFTGSSAESRQTVFAHWPQLGRRPALWHARGNRPRRERGRQTIPADGQRRRRHLACVWPVETISGVSSQFAGNGGYSSGALLASALTKHARPHGLQGRQLERHGWLLCRYVTPSDAATATAVEPCC